MPDPTIPTYRDLMVPTLEVLEESAGSLGKREIDAAIIARLAITDEQLAVAYPDGSKAKGSKVAHRLSFARSFLKLIGAADNSVRGVWAITPRGRELLATGPEAVLAAELAYNKQRGRRGKRPSTSEPPIEMVELEPEVDGEEVAEDTWRGELLAALQTMTPRGFERLCAQLLREEGCEEVTVTRFVGDDGLDGVGLLRVGLLSFPVYFQAKRYTGSVGPEKVREFRGALAGRADKGILITTGRFTKAAAEEASRAGSPIDLVDGDILCDLLLKHSLGVHIRPMLDQDAIHRFEG